MTTIEKDKKELMTTTAAPPSDGFDAPDDGGKSIIKGTKLKFTNGAQWIDDDDEVITKDREFLVVEIKRIWQKWLTNDNG
jgi:hypothetical protein